MGAYLSKPVDQPHSIDGYSKTLSYAASSMQGWRSANEDAHSCILDYDEGTSFFAVFDGHGGAEVAIYSASKLPGFIKNHPLYKSDDLPKALQEAFIDFDDSLRKPEVVEELKLIAETDAKESSANEAEEPASVSNSEEKVVEETDSATLRNEAKVPISDLLAKLYRKMLVARAGVPKSPVVKPKANGASDQTSNQPNKEETKAESSDAVKHTKEESSSSEVKHKPGTGGDVEQEAGGSKRDKPGPSVKADFLKSWREMLLGDLDEETSDEYTSSDASDNEAPDNDDDDDDDDDDEEDDEGEGEGEDNDDDEEDEDEDNDDDAEDNDDDDDEEEEDGENASGSCWAKLMEDMSSGTPPEPGKDSGCTAVVALFKNDTLHVANAGDSRCVLCRNGTAVDMSADHKPEDDIEKERISKAGGKISEDGRVNGGLNLSRAIGDHSYKTNQNLTSREQMITAFPDIQSCKINPETDEFVILACDGIWNSMTSQEVVDFVRDRIDKTDKLSQICEELFRACLAENTTGDGTGCDNMTCIIVRTKKPQEIINSPEDPIVEPTPQEQQKNDDEVKTNGDSAKRKSEDGGDEDVGSKRVK